MGEYEDIPGFCKVRHARRDPQARPRPHARPLRRRGGSERRRRAVRGEDETARHSTARADRRSRETGSSHRGEPEGVGVWRMNLASRVDWRYLRATELVAEQMSIGPRAESHREWSTTRGPRAGGRSVHRSLQISETWSISTDECVHMILKQLADLFERLAKPGDVVCIPEGRQYGPRSIVAFKARIVTSSLQLNGVPRSRSHEPDFLRYWFK